MTAPLMINENNNGPEIEIFLIFSLLSLGCHQKLQPRDDLCTITRPDFFLG